MVVKIFCVDIYREETERGRQILRTKREQIYEFQGKGGIEYWIMTGTEEP